MMGILVSIIIPVYCVKVECLKRCIDSMLAQGMADSEVIVVLDGEQRVYYPLLNQYEEERVRVIVERHRGVSSARNAGIEAARGKWVLFVDADDWLSKDCFAAFETMLRTEENCIIMFDYVMEYSERVSMGHCYHDTKGIPEKEQKEKFISSALRPQTGVGFVWGKFLSRATLMENHLRFNENLVMAEDAEFMIRIICYFDTIYYSSRSDYHYFFNPQSAVRRFRSDYAQNFINSMGCVQDFVRQYLPEHQRDCDNFILYHLLLISVNYSFHPDNPEKFYWKIKHFKELVQMPLFSNALKNLNLKHYSITRKVTIIFVRLRFYLGVAVIARVRHMQFRVSHRGIWRKKKID